jgi:hypothetical protein
VYAPFALFFAAFSFSLRSISDALMPFSIVATFFAVVMATFNPQ